MIHWLGLTDDTVSIKSLDSTLKTQVAEIQWFTDKAELNDAVANTEHAIVLLKSSDVYDIFELSKEISLSNRLHSTILLVSEEENDLKKAIRAGAAEMIDMNASETEMINAIEEVRNALLAKAEKITTSNNHEKREGKVITVCSTKGGVGKTTLSVNLASAFSKQQFKVAILDLDLQFGDVSIQMDVKPKQTIYEWVKEEYGYQETSIKRFMLSHSSGVDILSSPLRPEFSEVITDEHIKVIIADLKHHYDIIIVDTAPFLVETSLMALEQSEEILLITTKDLPTLKNNKLYIETLASLGLKEKIKVILNCDRKVKGILTDMIEEILGLPLYDQVPNDDKFVPLSVNEGIPIVISKPKAKVAKKINAIAAKLYPNNQLIKSKRKFLIRN
ncbi:CpaE family protein [Anaerobacillus sp. MEB173]|uniref:AAA family ATPase n=1 Tax=Anaerobacillus sp. MEB173 TaxID=3383345 RepID=UPI003F93620D